jgi:hypothetical protein
MMHENRDLIRFGRRNRLIFDPVRNLVGEEYHGIDLFQLCADIAL